MRTLIHTLLALTLVVPALARAQESTAERFDQALEHDLTQRSRALVDVLITRSLDNARRSLVLGPSLGLAPLVELDDGDLGYGIDLGLMLMRFDIPLLPDPNALVDVVKGHAKRVLLAEIASAIASGESLSEEDMKALVQETWEDLREELLLEHQAKRFEKPAWVLRADVGRFSAEQAAWKLGFSFGIGVGPVFLSAGEWVQFNHGAGLDTSLELSVPMTLSRGLRSPTAEFFLRYSIANNDRQQRPDRIWLGARIMLDVI